VAHAASVVGETQAAEDITNKVLEVNPDNREAVKMREDIKREAVKQRIPLKTKPSTTTRPTEKTRPQAAVPAPAPVFQDTGHLLRKFQLVPKSVKTIEKWDKNN
jgi:hypothetical protein